MKVAASQEMNRYFKALQDEANRCYGVATEARKKGLDPELNVEILQAEDLASRVEKLLKLDGIAAIIREAAKTHNREEMSIIVAKKIANEYEGPENVALDMAVRVGLAVLTEGILVAPLDGIGEVKIHGSGPNSYASISFAGPIRSAGGTGQAMSVLIADVVRNELGIGPYIATDDEVARWKEEIPLYKRLVNLQYLPSEEEIEFIIRGCKVCVDGEGTEDSEISGFRDLPRMETNRVRGGACLVVAEGLALKAKKLKGHVKKLGLEGWEFLNKIVKDKGDDPGKGLEPNEKFIKDMVAGRPVYSHPSRKGGFRLRYGRSRTAGLASISVHPSVMYLMQETLAIGTQIKIERPGKAGITTPCDQLEAPLVLMKNGDLVRLHDLDRARKLKSSQIDKIVDMGEILIPVGEFLENNHPLVPGVFDIGWYMAELDELGLDDPETLAEMDLEMSLELAREKGAPLHPRYTFMWNNLEHGQVMQFRQQLVENGRFSGGNLEVPDTSDMRRFFMELRMPYIVSGKILKVESGHALFASLGIDPEKPKKCKVPDGKFPDTLALISTMAGFRIMDTRGTYIGARMARPEKAAMRKMDPPVHGLFPVGDEGGTQRLISKAAEGTGRINVDIEVRTCLECGKNAYLPHCECGGHTVSREIVEEQEIDMYTLMKRACGRLGMVNIPKVKGVQGMLSKYKTVEMPEKGMLRAKNDVFMFKDGTCRFDCTDAPLTHFKPSEIGTGIEKLKEMGYALDIHGNPLESKDQVLELRTQDVVLPESGGDYFLQVSKFIDELLSKFYGMKGFYNAHSRNDLVGSALLGLSPHTSGGVLCRVIGFSKACVGYAHPFFHAAKRRNCDGDEDCFMLLMDGLLNFSVSYLPEKRGGRMDAPLVLMTRIDPNEIDKEAHNIDVMYKYPLAMYKASLNNVNPKELGKVLDTVGSRIGSNLQYENFGYTLDTTDISGGPTVSSYKTLESMDDKTQVQMELARLIMAVDEKDVAERLLNNHFIPDMIGNLRTFSNQKLRCTKCKEKYRRMPLAGHCKCGNKLNLTVHVKSVMKYLEMSKAIAKEYDVSPYVSQKIELLEEGMASLFVNDKVKDCKITDYF
jgi:DNA polymerase II large subunit